MVYTAKQGIHRHQTLPRCRNAVSAIRPTTPKRNVIHKTGSTQRISKPPEEDQAMATGNLHNKFCDDRSSGSRDMLMDRQTHRSQYSAPLPGCSNNWMQFLCQIHQDKSQSTCCLMMCRPARPVDANTIRRCASSQSYLVLFIKCVNNSSIVIVLQTHDCYVQHIGGGLA